MKLICVLICLILLGLMTGISLFVWNHIYEVFMVLILTILMVGIYRTFKEGIDYYNRNS